MKLFKLLAPLLFTFPFGSSNQLIAQQLGYPYIQNYKSNVYRGHAQVSCIMRDQKGLVYIGTEPGVGVYDGSNWQWIQVSDNKGIGVRCLTEGKDGRIYVGSDSELGYIHVDETGNLTYQSLVDYLPEMHRNFGLTWAVHSSSDGIYFRTTNVIFKWNPTAQEMKFWEKGAYGGFQFSTVIEDQLYVRQWDRGLLKMTDDRLELVPNGEQLANDRMYIMLPFDDHKMLMGVRTQGLLLYDGKNFTPFPTEIDESLRQYPIYLPGAKFRDDQFIIGTLGGGIFIINKQGKLVQHLTTQQGLTADNIFYHFLDHQNILWLSTADGLSMVALNDPLQYFDSRKGVEGGVFSIQQFQDRLYIGTEGGIAYYDNTTKRFEQVENSGVQPFQLQATADGLFAATNLGLQFINDGRAKTIPFAEDRTNVALSFCLSRRDSNLIYVSTFGGFEAVRKQASGNWAKATTIPAISQTAYRIVEDQMGNLWLSTRSIGVLKVQFPNFPDLEKVAIQTINLPKDATVDLVNDTLFACSYEGIFRWNEAQQQFEKIDSSQTGFRLDQSGGIWNVQANKRGLSYTKGQQTQTFGTMRDVLIYYESIFQSEEGKPIWIGSADGLAQFDPKHSKDTTVAIVPVLFSAVTTTNNESIYAGLEAKIEETYSLDFEQNQIRFDFAAPMFPKEEQVTYSTRLLGFEQNWTNWSERNSREFTNLTAGTYSFEARSRNADGQESAISRFNFEIGVPWWQTAWAFLIYALLLALLTYGTILLVRRNTNKRLAYQSALQYKEINELKTRFYTNITHEFRTPLTVILGMAQEEKDFSKARTLITRNGKKLLQLINQLLDLSKLDGKHLQPNYQQIEIVSFTQYIGESFQSLAEKKYIRLTIYSELKELYLDMDEEKYRQIISNLLSNAIKFTPESGKIILHLSKKEECLSIKITDSGVGIEPNELPHIFDRFYQVENVQSKQGIGTGIGLALVKELVQLLDGTVEVESKIQVGTIFSMQFPIRQTAAKRLNSFEKITVDRTIIENDQIHQTTLLKDAPKLLIIEDNPDVVLYIQSILKSSYELDIAKNGEEGIDKAIEMIPDIIISDVMMPKKNGFEVVESLKQDERTSHIPIVLLTAKATQEDKVEGLKYGADAYLMKPFDKEELLLRLKNLIAIRQQLQVKYAQVSNPFKVSDTSLSIEEQFLLKVRQQIEANYTKSDFDVAALAQQLQMSRMQLYRKLKAVSNQTVAQLIREVRLEKAKILLQNEQFNISEIAYELGYNDPNYFIRQFTKAFQQSPNTYRKSL